MKKNIILFFFAFTLQASASQPASCKAVEKCNPQQIEAQKATYKAKVRSREKLPTTSKRLVTLPSKPQKIKQQQEKLAQIHLEQALEAPLRPETQRANDLIVAQYIIALREERENKKWWQWWQCVIQ